MKYADSTPLEQVIEAPRAIKALKGDGFVTVGDLEDVTVDRLMAIKGVGERTIERIRELHTDIKEDDIVVNVEEGMHPIHMHSPNAAFALHLLPGDRIGDKFGYRLVPPVFVEFSEGRGQMSAKLWFTRKYKRDRLRVEQAIKDKEAWRVEACEWLKARRSYGQSFYIMTD